MIVTNFINLFCLCLIITCSSTDSIAYMVKVLNGFKSLYIYSTIVHEKMIIKVSLSFKSEIHNGHIFHVHVKQVLVFFSTFFQSLLKIPAL